MKMETFNSIINGGQLVLVDFFATWCQPCKMMHPILEQVKGILGDRIRIIKVDVDKSVPYTVCTHTDAFPKRRSFMAYKRCRCQRLTLLYQRICSY